MPSREIENLSNLSQRAARYASLGEARRNQLSSVEATITGELPLEELVSRSETVTRLGSRIARIKEITAKLQAEETSEDQRINQGLEKLASAAPHSPAIAAVYEPFKVEYDLYKSRKTSAKTQTQPEPKPKTETLVKPAAETKPALQDTTEQTGEVVGKKKERKYTKNTVYSVTMPDGSIYSTTHHSFVKVRELLNTEKAKSISEIAISLSPTGEDNYHTRNVARGSMTNEKYDLGQAGWEIINEGKRGSGGAYILKRVESYPDQPEAPVKPAAEAKPTRSRAKKEVKRTKPKEITIHFRDGKEVLTRETRATSTVRSLLNHKKTLEELIKTQLGEVTPETTRNMKMNILPDARAFAKKNDHLIIAEKQGENVFYVVRQIVRGSKNNPEGKLKGRSYEKTATIDIYSRGSFSIELPNGKKAEITGGLNAAIVDAKNRGLSLRDDIANDIYSEVSRQTRGRISTGVDGLNKKIEPHNYKLTHPSLKELRNGAPYEFAWEQIIEEKPQQSVLEESLTSTDITNYEAQVLASMIRSPKIAEELKAREIPELDEKTKEQMMQSAIERTAPSNEDMVKIRANIIRKMQEIMTNDTFNESFDRSELCAKLMLTYFKELGDKRQEVFDILIEHLKKDTDIAATLVKWRVQDVKITHVDRGLAAGEAAKARETEHATRTRINRRSGAKRARAISGEHKPPEKRAAIETDEVSRLSPAERFARDYPNLSQKHPRAKENLEAILDRLMRIPDFSNDLLSYVNVDTLTPLGLPRDLVNKARGRNLVQPRQERNVALYGSVDAVKLLFLRQHGLDNKIKGELQKAAAEIVRIRVITQRPNNGK